MTGVCPHCGRAGWNRDSAIKAVQAFAERNGYQPVSSEAGKHHQLPSWPVVVKLFGSWNAMIETAGFRPYPAQASVHAKRMAFLDRNPS